MTTLLDIVPATEKVLVAGTELNVFGVSAEGFAVILERFPDIQKIMAGKGSSVTGADFVKLLPQAVSTIIAAGCGYPGDAAAEDKASKLSIDDQVEIISAIFRLTLPRGVGPFVDRLRALGLPAAVPSMKDQASK